MRHVDEDSFEDEFDEVSDFGDGSDDTDDGLAGDYDGSDDFSTGDAFILGGAMGYAFEEGLDERQRRVLLRKKGKKNHSND